MKCNPWNSKASFGAKIGRRVAGRIWEREACYRSHSASVVPPLPKPRTINVKWYLSPNVLSVLRRLKTPKLTQAEKGTQSSYAWIRYMSRAPFSLCNSQRFLSEALLLSFSLTSSTAGHVHAGRENGLVTGLKWYTILSWVHPISTESCRRNGLGEKNLEKTVRLVFLKIFAL